MESSEANLREHQCQNKCSIITTHLAATSSNILCGQHSGVGGGLVTVGLDLHSTSNARDGFLAREIRDVDESVVERCEDVRNAEDELAIGDLRAEGDGGGFLGSLGLLGGLQRARSVPCASRLPSRHPTSNQPAALQKSPQTSLRV